MHWCTETMADPLHTALFGFDIEGARSTHQDAPNVDTLFGPSCDHSSYEIPRLKSLDLLCPFWFRAGKSDVVDIAFLPASMPFGGDLQGSNPCQTEVFRRALTNVRRVNPMILRQVLRRSVEFRQTARATLDGQAQRLQSLKQGPSCCVDGGGILQRFLRLIENLLEQLRLFNEKHSDIQRPFRQIAGFTGQTQVAETIATLFGSGPDVCDLQRHVGLLAIATVPPPLFQQVFPDLVALEDTLLVFQIADFRVFQSLQIEAYKLLAESDDWRETAQTLNPGHNVADSALQGWWKPALSSPPIEEPWLSVARCALSSVTAHNAALVQGLLDRLPAMLQMSGKNHLSCRIIDQSHARCPAPRINLDSQRLNLWALHRRFEDQRKWVAFVHRRLALFEQEPRIPRMHRVEWLIVRIDHKDF